MNLFHCMTNKVDRYHFVLIGQNFSDYPSCFLKLNPSILQSVALSSIQIQLSVIFFLNVSRRVTLKQITVYSLSCIFFF